MGKWLLERTRDSRDFGRVVGVEAWVLTYRMVDGRYRVFFQGRFDNAIDPCGEFEIQLFLFDPVEA